MDIPIFVSKGTTEWCGDDDVNRRSQYSQNDCNRAIPIGLQYMKTVNGIQCGYCMWVCRETNTCVLCNKSIDIFENAILINITRKWYFVTPHWGHKKCVDINNALMLS